MRTTYGVVWREGEAGLARGKLELLPTAVRLEGLAGATPVTRELRYDELETVHVGRSPLERLNGLPTLVLTPYHGAAIVLAAVAQAGVIAELTDRLAKVALV